MRHTTSILFVIPAHAGIQLLMLPIAQLQTRTQKLDPGMRRDDDDICNRLVSA